MGQRKRAALIVAGVAAAVALIVAAAFALSAPAAGGRVERAAAVASSAGAKTKKDSTSRSKKPKGSPVQDQMIRATVSDLCSAVAPKALTAYAIASSGRARLLARYFTSDADGLSIPVDRIARQPLESSAWTGFELTGTDRSAATCSVSTGLASPWIMEWTFSPRVGWRCSSVTAPLEGGLAVLADSPDAEASHGSRE